MSQVIIAGDTSGTITLQAPAVSGSTTLTLPAATGTVMVSGNMPAFSAYASSNQTGITSGVATKITLDTEIFDTNSNFASSRFTPTVAGYYQINCTFRTAGTGITSSYLNLYKNGSVYARLAELGSATGSTSGLNTLGSTIVSMNGSTDYLEIYGVITGASGLQFDAANSTGQYSCAMSGCLVRGA
jgi:hypothetical protein